MEFNNPHQRGIVKRYYKHKDDIMAQKLSELLSDLYLCTDAKKAKKLWKSAETALNNLKVPPKKVETCVSKQDVELLAEIVEELF